MSGKQRTKLDSTRSSNLLGKGRGDKGFGKPFCVERTGPDQILFYRVYVPGPGRDDQLITALRRDAEQCLLNPQIARWILAKAFSFAILFEEKERLNRFQLKLLGLDTLPVPIHLELVPGPHTLAETVRSVRTLKEHQNG